MSYTKYNKILDQKESRKAVIDGIKLATELVAPTLGNSSRRILIDKEFGEINSSDDGAMILSTVDVEDTQTQLGVKVAREASAQTDADCGDGTTTTCVILNELTKNLLKFTEKQENVMAPNSGNNLKVRKEIRAGLEKVLAYINDNKIEITSKEQIAFVGAVSANDKKIGEMLADVFDKLGSNGSVSTQESNRNETTYEITEGFSLSSGWIAPQFVTDPEREEAVLEDDVHILVSSKKIQDIEDIKPLADLVRGGLNNILVIAEDIKDAPLGTFVFNKLGGSLRIIAIKAPVSGNTKDTLLDICTATGATLFGDDVKLEDLKEEHFGKADRVVSKKDKTIIVGFGGDKKKIDERVKLLKNKLEKEDSDYEKKALKERISKLMNGVGSIKVGGNTPMEIKDKKAKIDDAVAAVKAALRGGIVPGGGVTLLQASSHLGGNKGEDILLKAIQKPFQQILENADVNDDSRAEVILTGRGYNTETEEYVDMIEAGIIDPTDVVKSAVKNAVSSALVVANIGGAITLVRKEEDDGETA